MRSKLLVLGVVSIASVVAFASSANAQIQRSLERSMQTYEYPAIEPDVNLFCYVTTKTPTNFDLGRLCGSIAAPPSISGGYGGSSYSGDGASSGACNSPNDTASDGSRCGGRASSEKKGGRR